MNIMQSLLKEFAPPVSKHAIKSSAAPTQSAECCAKCGGIDHWQPHGQSNAWYCVHCDPPPTQSMVAHRSGAPTIKQSVAYSIGHRAKQTVSCGGNLVEYLGFHTQSVCGCGSHMVVENTWPDGLVTFECASCSAGIAAAALEGS